MESSKSEVAIVLFIRIIIFSYAKLRIKPKMLEDCFYFMYISTKII